MSALKPLHFAAGLIGLIAFVLTGQYMSIFLHGMAGIADGPRLLYRSSHLYLMWSALVNLLVGVYFTPAETRGARLAQAISSLFLLAGLPLILAGFFIESPADNLSRWYSGMANYLALAGVLSHVLASHKAAHQGTPQGLQ